MVHHLRKLLGSSLAARALGLFALDGGSTHEGRLCPTCGRNVSKEKLIGLAKQGRVVAQSLESRKKRSETQSGHEAAKRRWRDSSDAASVDREKYDKEIQPRLALVPIARIASTLVSANPTPPTPARADAARIQGIGRRWRNW